MVVVGDIQGHADSLISIMSVLSTPPKTRYLFLGNYVGPGFARHEVLLMLLAFKVSNNANLFMSIRFSGSFSEKNLFT